MDANHSRRLTWLWVAVAGMLTAGYGWIVARDLAPWVRGPAPYPPEWEWLYQPLDLAALPTLTLIAAYLVYALLVALALHPTRVRWRSPRVRRNVALALGVAGFAGLQIAVAWANKGHVLNDIIWHTYEPPGNGYFMTAVRVEDFWQTLYSYAAAMPDFPASSAADTPARHLPVLFGVYRALRAAAGVQRVVCAAGAQLGAADPGLGAAARSICAGRLL
jgi:hypothetical protein